MIRTDAVQHLLPEQRWFGGKGRTIERVEVIDEMALGEADPPLILGIIRVHFDSDSHLYQVLLSDNGEEMLDPFTSSERLGVLGRLMAGGETRDGNKGHFHFGGPSLDPLAPPENNARRLQAEQTNTSIVLDDSVVLKLFRRLDVGPNPDLELNRLLTAEGWPHVPPQLGEISYSGEFDGRAVEIDLGIAQELITGATDGWPFVLGHVGEMLEAALRERPKNVATFLTDHCEELFICLEDLGDATASLHLMLSRDVIDQEMMPEPVSASELETWGRSLRSSVREAVSGDEELAPVTRHLQEALEVENVEEPGMKIRIHGDYHLGQVMLSDKGWLIVDFEGEPARSIAERRTKRSPLRDVAGMLRSFSYAAAASLFDLSHPGAEDWDYLEMVSQTWEAQARERFATAYRTTSYEGNFLPSDEEGVTALLDAFEIEKALYELTYERSHRPEWERIPRRGLKAIVERRWSASSG